MAMTGPAISRAPCIAAWTGDFPSSIWRKTFSTTTMASSTTRPMASTMASSVSRLRLKPAAYIKVPAPISDSGMVTIGISTVRIEPRNRKITTTTTPTAMAKRPDHLVDGGLDELASIVGHVHLQRRRQGVRDARKLLAHAAHHRQRIARGRRLHADEHRVLAVHGHAGVEALRVERDGRDVLQPDQRRPPGPSPPSRGTGRHFAGRYWRRCWRR